MKLVVVSHKPCWPSVSATSGFATFGGFPFQMRGLAELFDRTVLVLPSTDEPTKGEVDLDGPGLTVVTLTSPRGVGLPRKLRAPFWTLRNLPRLVTEIARADAVHVPIPGDVGTIGMLIAYAMRKPLFVRYCGNWLVQTTAAERFWRWFMETVGGGQNVMLATGGAPEPPSHNPEVRWIFSSTLTEEEIQAIRAERQAPPDSRARLIIVCRQDGGKGTEILVESLPLVLKQFSGASLDIVGDGTSLPALKQLVSAKGLASRVTFHGAVDHESVIRLLRQADVFCYPTATEGFPKVVLEALACGLPIVTTRVSVLPYLVQGCGVLLDAATPAAVADAVGLTLADPVRYCDMSAAACSRAREYSLERWRDTIGGFLQEAWGPLQRRVLVTSEQQEG